MSAWAIAKVFAAIIVLIAVAIWVMNAFMRRHDDSWRAFGLEKRPLKNTGLVFGLVILGTAVLSAVVLYIDAIFGEAPDLTRFNPVEGNLTLLLGTLVSIWVTAAIAEEIIYRGFILNRLAAAFAGLKRPWFWAVVAQAVIFGLGHFYQGPIGIIATGLVGALMGTVYVLMGRNLVALILAHGVWDSIVIIGLYLGLV